MRFTYGTYMTFARFSAISMRGGDSDHRLAIHHVFAIQGDHEPQHPCMEG